MTDDDPAPAVGYVRTDLSGAAAEFDRAQIIIRAARLGYVLIGDVLEHTAATAHRTEHLLAVIYTHRAEAVIVPTLAHLDKATFDLVLPGADIITTQPYETYARQWTSVQVYPNRPFI
ncbi:hypothetical protein IU440_11780 [Nocardia cyriacigeorgica]|uniref:hypothetical protein n=1 Tax=Nocardia cyriacigeorgica TaxID=135487 RepID=UPI00189545B1|nr:hypothetical protein [Nocardia cyriacigeorgica]MBF6287675.1 hypothetical protein [Nocardia cyriacigeorgica]MBF6425363.1 hypothetical protein [Nocardia cyriacigeorgica]BDU09156.1 hypothetical protein FMUBM48_54190 [Nocardia cyriacigeorgica]